MQSSRSAFSIEPAPVAGTFLMITSKAVQAAFFAASEADEATVVNWSDMELGQAASAWQNQSKNIFQDYALYIALPLAVQHTA